MEELEQNVRPGLVATTEAVTLLHSEVKIFFNIHPELRMLSFQPIFTVRSPLACDSRSQVSVLVSKSLSQSLKGIHPDVCITTLKKNKNSNKSSTPLLNKVKNKNKQKQQTEKRNPPCPCSTTQNPPKKRGRSPKFF